MAGHGPGTAAVMRQGTGAPGPVRARLFPGPPGGPEGLDGCHVMPSGEGPPSGTAAALLPSISARPPRAGRWWRRDDVEVAPEPGPGERWAVRPPVAGAERGGFGDGAAEQPAGRRPVGQYADVVRGGVRQQAGLDAAAEQVIGRLHGLHRQPARPPAASPRRTARCHTRSGHLQLAGSPYHRLHSVLHAGWLALYLGSLAPGLVSRRHMFW